MNRPSSSLANLPPEILREIIEWTIPHEYSGRNYCDRQQCLSALSLVSRRFRDIAQPLLSTIVKLVDINRSGFSGAPRHKGDVRELIIVAGEYERSWKHLVRSFPGVRKLILCLTHGFALALSELGELPHLETFDGISGLQLLDPVILPSLRRLAIHDYMDDRLWNNPEEVKQPRLLELFLQLDVAILSIGAYVLVEKDLFATGASDRILVDVCPSVFRNPPTYILSRIRHMRMRDHSAGAQDKGLVQNLRAISTTLQDSPSVEICLLYLPSLGGATVRAAAFEELREVCEKQRVELVVEEYCCRSDPVWSWDFCRRRRRVEAEA
ncbi:hypothetical protein JCM11491_005864 [Sporobolomyces phaffii]